MMVMGGKKSRFAQDRFGFSGHLQGVIYGLHEFSDDSRYPWDRALLAFVFAKVLGHPGHI